MATQRRTTRQKDPEILPPDSDEFGDGYITGNVSRLPAVDEDEELEQKELNDVMAELGGTADAYVNIFRVSEGKDSRGGEFVDSVHPSTFSLMWLRDNYGGGSYRIHIRAGGRIYGNRHVKIANRLPTTNPANYQQNSNTLEGLEKIVGAMQAGFQQLGQLIVQSRPAPIDPQQMQNQMLQNMLTMKQILGPSNPVPVQDAGEKYMDAITKGIELAKSITPREGEVGTMDVLLEAVKNFAGPIAAATMQAQANQQMVAPISGTVPAQIPTSVPAMVMNPAPISYAQNQTPEDQMKFVMKYYVDMLVGLAQQQKDPTLYAEWILDQAPTETLDQIFASPDIIGWLASFNSEVNNHRPWFEQLKQSLYDLTAPDETASVGTSDNSGTVFANATHDATGEQSDADDSQPATDS
jgi:hypothetical protein